MRLVIDWATLESTRHGTISAGIWLETETAGFPEPQWSDTVVAVTRAFVEATDRLTAAGSETTQRVYFLDGPFSVTLTRTGDRKLLLRGFRREQDFGWEGSVELAGWTEQLHAAGRQLIDECAAKGWRDADVEALEARLGSGDPAR